MAFFSQIYNLLFTSNYAWNVEKRVLIIGLDAAGKTTMLYRLKGEEDMITIPTIGFNVESINYKNISFTVWDVGGRDKSRPLWRHYYQNTDAIMFVVDSTDHNRMNGDSGYGYGIHARDLLYELVNDAELKDAVILLWANKQDLPNALSGEEVAKRLGIEQLKNRTCKVFECVATTGEGLYDGLGWLSDVLNGKTDSNGKSGVLTREQKYSKGEKLQLNPVGEYFRSFFC